jgi:Na+/H+ antiporter NhaD/arsenite permease-like protein
MTLLQLTALLVIVATLVGVAIGRWPWLRMNRATIALTGATALIAIGAIPLEDAYAALDLDTLIFAMMIINYNLRRAGFFQIVAERVIHHAHTSRQLLAYVIVASGVLSAIFLNDTIVLVFTPLVLDLCLALNQRPIPYLVALVTAANIGSVATIIGNPQNMLIGVASGISFNTFTLYLAPVALAGLAVIWLVVVLVFRRDFGGRLVKEPVVRLRTEPALLRKSLAATAVMLAGFIFGFPIPLAALVGAAILLISRRLEPEAVFREIDLSLLVFFGGLFIVTGAIQSVGLSGQLFSVARPLAEQGVAALSLVAVVLSNLVSNVPAVLLFRPYIPDFPNPTQAWLTLAMSTTLAGNLTLLGSVANLIVAEIAFRRAVNLSFTEYLKAGPLITAISLTLGIVWLTVVLGL